MLEAGARFEDGDYPNTSFEVQKYLFAPAAGCYGIQRIDMVKDCLIVAGAGVGGGSLVYANTLYEPLDAVLPRPVVGAHHRLEVRAGALLRPGEADARRGRVPLPHARPTR